MFAELFILLYVAHLTADYPLQTDHQAAHKADCSAAGWRANAAHALTHFVVTFVVLPAGLLVLDASVPPWAAAVSLVWIAATHAVIDRRWPVARWMKWAGQTEWAKHGGAAHVDQTAHVIALAIAALFLAAV